MTEERRQPTADELPEYMGQSGRALRHLHDREYDQAITLLSRLQGQFSFPVNVANLARAYQETGRVSEALAVLEQGVRDHPGEQPLANLLQQTRERRYELLVRHAVASLVREPSVEVCRDLLGRNGSLADEMLREVLRQNAFLYAQRLSLEVLAALVLLHQELCKRWQDDAHRADVLELEGLYAYVRGDLTRALPPLRQACDHARRAGAEQQLISCLNHLGLAAAGAGALAEAEQAYAEAVRRCEAGNDPLNAARFEENLGGMLLDGNPARALEIVAQTERRYAALGDRPLEHKARSLRGKALAALGRLDEALPLLDECLIQGRSLWSEMPLVLADVLAAKGNVLEDMGRLTEAEAVRREAEDLYRRLRVPVPHRGINRAGVSAALNRFEEAKRESEDQIRRHEAAGMALYAARERLNLAGLHCARLAAGTAPGSDADDAEMQAAAEGFREARRLLEEAVTTFSRCDAPLLLLGARMQRATLLGVEGKVLEKPELLQEALAEYEELIEQARRHGFRGKLPALLENKAVILENLGRGEDARRVLDERLAHDPDRPPASANACRLLAHRLAAAGNDEAARRLHERAVELHDAEEAAVGVEALVIDWSRDRMAVFDDAVTFFAERGQGEAAFEVVQRAKARTFRRLLSRPDAEPLAARRRSSPAQLATRLEEGVMTAAKANSGSGGEGCAACGAGRNRLFTLEGGGGTVQFCRNCGTERVLKGNPTSAQIASMRSIFEMDNQEASGPPVTVSCPKCGRTEMVTPPPAGMADVVVCPQCGHVWMPLPGGTAPQPAAPAIAKKKWWQFWK